MLLVDAFIELKAEDETKKGEAGKEERNVLVVVVLCLKGRRQEIDEFCVNLDAIGVKERERKEGGREREKEKRREGRKWKKRGRRGGKKGHKTKGDAAEPYFMKRDPSIRARFCTFDGAENYSEAFE